MSSLTNKQTKKLKTREFEEKKIDRSAFGKGKTVKIRENIFAVRAISYRELSRIMAQAALPDRAVIFSNTIFTL